MLTAWVWPDKLTIEFLHIFKCVCWSPKPKFHHPKVLFFLGCCQWDLVGLNVPVGANVSCGAGKQPVFQDLPWDAEFSRYDVNIIKIVYVHSIICWSCWEFQKVLTGKGTLLVKFFKHAIFESLTSKPRPSPFLLSITQCPYSMLYTSDYTLGENCAVCGWTSDHPPS